MADARVLGRLDGWPLRTLVAACLIAGGLVVGSTPVPAAQVASLVASPSPLSRPSALNDVDCVTPTDCFAVGWYTPEQTSEPSALVEHWDGTSWKVVDSPSPAGERTSRLAGVKCVSSNHCVAVGSSSPPLDNENTAPVRTLAEQWDGTSWKIVTTPRIASPPSLSYWYLLGVDCTSTTNCWAVGYAGVGGSFALVEHWNGISWNVVVNPGRTGDSWAEKLLNVSCTAVTNCVAVGDFYAQSRSGEVHRTTLVERWNGLAWKTVPSPNPDPFTSILEGVTCTATSNCLATGYSYDRRHSRSLTLVERWNGTKWTIVPSPTPAATLRSGLAGVACTTSRDCLAVGSDQSLASRNTVLEHWNGTKWSVVANPIPASFPSVFLQGVACKDTVCFAVGQRVERGHYSTLVERYS